MAKRRKFSKEFKLEAVRLLDQGDQTGTALARELGVPRNRLYKWKDQLLKQGATQAFNGPGRRMPKQAESSELERLHRENEQLRQERDILKKAAAYFAKELP